MEFLASLRAKACAHPVTILMPESTEPRILQAAAQAVAAGLFSPVLLGMPAEVAAAAGHAGVSLDGIRILDDADENLRESAVQYCLSAGSFLSEKSIRRKLRDPLNLAAALVAAGHANALAAGVSCPTGDVILAAQTFIGMQAGVETPSSIGIVEFPDERGVPFAITDCAVNIRPTAEQLSDIAAASAQTVRSLLSWTPRIAMLSFSTLGSSACEESERIANAVHCTRERHPSLLVDGEFQLDAAILPEIAARKVKVPSDVAGQANVLVFPDLNAGNIGVKLLQIFGHATAHGPMLQGFAKPVTDFSRSAPVEEMLGNLAMLAVRAQSGGK